MDFELKLQADHFQFTIATILPTAIYRLIWLSRLQLKVDVIEFVTIPGKRQLSTSRLSPEGWSPGQKVSTPPLSRGHGDVFSRPNEDGPRQEVPGGDGHPEKGGQRD